MPQAKLNPCLPCLALNPKFARRRATGKGGSSKKNERKRKPWITREGKLGGAGYLSKSATTRQRLLNRCVKKYSYRSCLGSIQALQRTTQYSAAQQKKLAQDHKYLVTKYGGPGSFLNPTISDVMVVRVTTDLDRRAKKVTASMPKKAAQRKKTTRRIRKESKKANRPKKNPITAAQIARAATR